MHPYLREGEKMMDLSKLIIFINVLAFLAMGYDKFQAKRGGWRIPEANLLVLAALLGGVGAFFVRGGGPIARRPLAWVAGCSASLPA